MERADAGELIQPTSLPQQERKKDSSHELLSAFILSVGALPSGRNGTGSTCLMYASNLIRTVVMS